MSSGFRDMWVWKATLKQTLKLREVLLYHRPRHLWISFLPARPSNRINGVLLTTGISATHIPESIWCSLAVSISSNAGNVTGPETSAWRWLNYALVILRCWQVTFTGSGVGTPPPVHTATALTRPQNIWCYSAQLTTGSRGTSGQEKNSTRTLDAFGTSSNGLGRWLAALPPTGNRREYTYRRTAACRYLADIFVCYFLLLSFFVLRSNNITWLS